MLRSAKQLEGFAIGATDGPIGKVKDFYFDDEAWGTSNAGLEAAIKSAGGRVIRTAVGDRNVIDEMLRGGFNFGGEQSGHLIFRDFSTTGDGLVAALQMLRILQARQRRSRSWRSAGRAFRSSSPT